MDAELPVESPVPSAKTVQEDLGPVLRLIRDSVLGSLQEARAYFTDRRERMPDPMFAPGMVRYLVKGHLTRAGHHAEELPEDDPFKFEALPNNGLLVVVPIKEIVYHIRVLKGDPENPDSGYLPALGASLRRQSFYAQQPVQLSFVQALGMEEPAHEGKRTVNLVFVWHVSRYYELIGMWLVCPKGGGTTRMSTSSFWHKPVMVGEPTTAWDAYGGTDDNVDDLDLGDDTDNGRDSRAGQ